MKRLAVLSMIAAAMLLAYSPAGWKWGGKWRMNTAHAGWSWNADIASVDGNTVTLVSNERERTDADAGQRRRCRGRRRRDGRPVGTGLERRQRRERDQPLGWTWNG